MGTRGPAHWGGGIASGPALGEPDPARLSPGLVSRSAEPLAPAQGVSRQTSLPDPAARKGSILKSSRSVSRHSSQSTRTIRFQRQRSFDHGSRGYGEPGYRAESLSADTEDDTEEEEEQGDRLASRRRAHLLREPSSFTGDEIMSMKAAFSKLDKDGDGHLSHTEVHTALGEMMPEEDVVSLLKEMDSDGDGQIDYQEFLSGMKKKVKEPESVKMLKEAFKVFDCDGSGAVTRDCMRAALLNTGNCPRAEVEEMLTELDLDNTGSIGLEDFLRIFVVSPSRPEEPPDRTGCVIL